MNFIEHLKLDVELLLAARGAKNARAVRKLLAAGAGIYAKDLWGNTPLHEAAWHGNPACVRELLKAGAAAETRTRLGATPLHRAAYKNRTDCVKLLLAAGAQPNARDKEDETPLHEAARCRSAESARLLLAHGAEVDALNRHGMTPLHAAIITESLKCEELLLKAGADPTARTHEGDTPLHTAARHGSVESLRRLLAMGADVHTCNKEGATPLLHATHGHICWRVDCLRLLIEAGASVNVQDANGRSPMFSLLRVCYELGKIICFPAEDRSIFAPPKRVTFKEYHAAISERGNGYYEANAALLLLAEAGADLNTPDLIGATILDYALMYAEPDVVCTLRAAGALYSHELRDAESPEMSVYSQVAPLPEPAAWRAAEDVQAYVNRCLQHCGMSDWECRIHAHAVCSGGVAAARLLWQEKQLLISPHILARGSVEARVRIVHELVHLLDCTLTDHWHEAHFPSWKRWAMALGAPGLRPQNKRLVELPPAAPHAPAESAAPKKEFYVLCHRETGEVFRRYAKRPGYTIAQLAELSIRKREPETQGKLCVACVPCAVQEGICFATYDELTKVISCMHERVPEISAAALRDYRRHGYKLCYLYTAEYTVDYE